VLKDIASNDYESFYESELEARKKYSYPPFTYLLKLECGYAAPKLGQSKCEALAREVLETKGFEVLGPAKSYPHIKNGKHFWKLVIKSKNRQKLVDLAKRLDNNWTINLDPYGIT